MAAGWTPGGKRRRKESFRCDDTPGERHVYCRVGTLGS